MHPLFVFIVLSVCVPVANATDWLEIVIQSPAQWQPLRQLLSDLEPPRNGVVTAYASPTEQVALRQAGFAFEVKIADLENYYAQRAQRGRRADAVGSMGGFRTFAEIEAELDRLQQSYPQLVGQKFPIGYSLEGRPLWALLLSDNPQQYEPDEPLFWLDGLHHAREPMSGETVLRLAAWLTRQYAQNPDIAYLLHTRQILLLPCLNPDGYVYNQEHAPNGGGLWRKNRRPNADGSVGVDLNRNYGWFWGEQWSGDFEQGSSSTPSDIDYRGTAAFSEPETQAVRDAIALIAPQIAITLHSYGQEWMYPWGYTDTPAADADRLEKFALAMADPRFRVGSAWQLYGTTNGATDDYFYGQHQVLAFTVEIGTPLDGFWPEPERIPALFEQMRPGLLQAAQRSGAWAHINRLDWQKDLGQDTWQLHITLENQGIETLQGEWLLPSCLPLRSHCPLHRHRLQIAPQQTQTLPALSLNIAPFTAQKPVLQALLNQAGESRWLDIPLPLSDAQAELPAAPTAPLLQLAGALQPGANLSLSVHSRPQAEVFVYVSQQQTAPYILDGIIGEIALAAPVLLWQASSDATGRAQWSLALPTDNRWQGLSFFVQALIVDAQAAQVTQLEKLQF